MVAAGERAAGFEIIRQSRVKTGENNHAFTMDNGNFDYGRIGNRDGHTIPKLDKGQSAGLNRAG